MQRWAPQLSWAAGIALLGALAVGCGGSAEDAGSSPSMGGDYAGEPQGGGGGGGAAPGGGGGGGGGGGYVEPEPETEVPVVLPQAGVHYVFLTDPSLDALVRIDAVTLDVTLIDVGGHPDVVAVFPGTDTAAVLSGGSDTLAVVDASPGAEPDVRTVKVTDGTNAITLGPTGGSAVVWFDAARATGSKLGPLQSVTLVRLGDGKPVSVEASVGFEPRGVAYTADGKTAFVVTRAGITAIPVQTVTESAVLPEIPVTDDPQGPAVEREVLVTTDGTRAVVRELGVGRLLVVDLKTEALSAVELPGQPTDLDLLHDGTTALAVLKDTGQVALLDLTDPGAADALTLVDIPGTAPGVAWVTEDDSLALLYTTTAMVESLVALDLTTLTTTTHYLQKAVKSVATTPDSQWAIVVHTRVFDNERGTTVRTQIDKEVDASFGYSVVDLQTGFVKLFLTDVDVAQVAFAPDDGKAYVMLPGGSPQRVAELRLGPLLEESIPLVSRPTGLVPVPTARRMAVPQDHDSGRVTFIDTQSGGTSTVTGFELNALID